MLGHRSESEPPGVALVELALTRGVEPISGNLRVDAAPARTFAGMLELMALLDAVRGGTAPEDDAS